MHEENSFLTLTYNDKNLPEGGTLNLEDIQLFMKRLRKFLEPKKIRFFQCGEYGKTKDEHGNVITEKYYIGGIRYLIPALGRPHHHIILFNHDFPMKSEKNPGGKVLHSEKNENKLYTSKTLETIWGKGFCTIGTVTIESASYVARYVTKKISGEPSQEHYKGRKKEFITMSRGGRSSKGVNAGGIGEPWLTKFRGDVYPDDFVVIQNKKYKTPKYYDSLFTASNPKEFEAVKSNRKSEHPYFPTKDKTQERLSVQEQVQLLNQKQIKREYEGD